MFISLYSSELITRYPYSDVWFRCLITLPIYCKPQIDVQNLLIFPRTTRFNSRDFIFKTYYDSRFILDWDEPSKHVDYGSIIKILALRIYDDLARGDNRGGVLLTDRYVITPPLSVRQEILSGYITTPQSSEVSDMNEILAQLIKNNKSLIKSRDYDMCKLYLLSALPYLGNCSMEYIKKFVNCYNNTIYNIHAYSFLGLPDSN